MNKQWLTESLTYLVYAVFGISWSVAGGLLPQIIHDLHLTVADGSFLTSVVSIAKIISALLTGFIISRFGIRRAFTLGAFLIGVSALSGLSGSYAMLLSLRFIMGLGAAICLVCLVPIVQVLFSKERQPFINAINATSNIVGAIVALGITAVLGMTTSWRFTLSFWGIISFIIAVLFYLVADKALDNKKVVKTEKKMSLSSFKEASSCRTTWAMILYYIYILNYLTVSFTYFPMYFKQYKHFEAGSLGSFTPMIINVGILIGPFLGSYLVRKALKPKVILLLGVIVSTITGLLSLYLDNQFAIAVMAATSGIAIGSIFPVFFSIPVETRDASAAKTGYIMSIFWCVTYFLSSISTWLMGYAVDQTHSFNFSITYMFLLSIFGYIGVYLIPKYSNQQ